MWWEKVKQAIIVSVRQKQVARPIGMKKQLINLSLTRNSSWWHRWRGSVILYQQTLCNILSRNQLHFITLNLIPRIQLLHDWRYVLSQRRGALHSARLAFKLLFSTTNENWAFSVVLQSSLGLRDWKYFDWGQEKMLKCSFALIISTKSRAWS